MNDDSKTLVDISDGEVAEILNSYLRDRCNYRQEPGDGERVIEENKTSVEIADELADMLPVSTSEVYRFMSSHGYRMITTADGRLKWNIFRTIEII